MPSLPLMASSLDLHGHCLSSDHDILSFETPAYTNRETSRSSIRYHLLVSVFGLSG